MADQGLPAPAGRNKRGLAAIEYASDVSLGLPAQLSFEEWRERGIQLWRAQRTLCWLIGDWWVYGERRGYGARTRMFADENWQGPALETCQNYGSVCRAFETTSRRNEVLSFSHHAAVAALPKEIADKLLAACLPRNGADRRTVSWLKDEVWRWKRENNPPIIVEYPPRTHPLLQELEDKWRRERLLRSDPLPKEERQGREERPASTLDNSPASGITPDELLTLKPAPTMDHAAIAAAALAKLESGEALIVVKTWYSSLPADVQDAVLAALHGVAAVG